MYTSDYLIPAKHCHRLELMASQCGTVLSRKETPGGISYKIEFSSLDAAVIFEYAILLKLSFVII